MTYRPAVRAQAVDRETFDAAMDRARTLWPDCPATGWWEGLAVLLRSVSHDPRASAPNQGDQA